MPRPHTGLDTILYTRIDKDVFVDLNTWVASEIEPGISRPMLINALLKKALQDPPKRVKPVLYQPGEKVELQSGFTWKDTVKRRGARRA